MREGKGFLLVYSIIDQQTVDVVQELHRKILRATEDPSIPMYSFSFCFACSDHLIFPSVLIGNKCDMISGRQVSYETGEKLAASWNVPFMETSAKSKQNNVECFCQLVREIKRKEDQLRLTIQEAKEEKNSRCHCVLI
jgi:GTPase SAR1 family protein